MTPYANPYTNKLNNIQPHNHDQLYNLYPYNDNIHNMHNPMHPETNDMSNVRTNNMYDPYADENVYEYDYSEPDDYHNTSIINDTGLNPMYKVTPNTQDTGDNASTLFSRGPKLRMLTRRKCLASQNFEVHVSQELPVFTVMIQTFSGGNGEHGKKSCPTLDIRTQVILTYLTII
jgi:hypothetical protein